MECISWSFVYLDVHFFVFQMMRVGSPNLDISYYLYNSVQKDVREKEWRNLLKIYYDEFSRCIQLMQGKMDFSFEVRNSFEFGYLHHPL